MKLLIFGTLLWSCSVLCLGEAVDLVESRFTNEDSCGVAVISKASARVVNGTSSVQGQWPWQAAVAVESGGSTSIICGGSLLNNDWVVTAAHCFDSATVESSLRVFLGVNDRTNSFEGNREIRSLRNRTCHPGYDGNAHSDDICMLHLDSAVSYTTYIRPICLPTQGSSVSAGQTCIVSGWGDTEGTGDSSILQYAEVPIINHTVCSTWYGEINTPVPDTHICAGFEQGGTDTCQGDSGGPLVCQETVSGSNSYVLRGVTSYGVGCADARRPGVYTEVADYIDWIDEIIAASGESSRCSYITIIFLLCVLVFTSQSLS